MTLIIGIPAALLLLYLLLPRLCARPRARHDGLERFAGPVAHRGLHSPAAPENSLAAFRAAADAGLGIELDVHACRDGLAVLHDGRLTRLCGDGRAVRDMTVTELTGLRLLGTDEHIPTLRQALDAVGGRVPLVIELKSMGLGSAVRLAQAAARELADYAGPCCVQSFNPWLLRACRRAMPDVPRGLLVAAPRDMRRICGFIGGWALGNLLPAPIARPHFVAHGLGQESAGVRAWRRRGGRCAVWTVTSRADMERALANGDIAIFEGAEALDAALKWRAMQNKV